MPFTITVRGGTVHSLLLIVRVFQSPFSRVSFLVTNGGPLRERSSHGRERWSWPMVGLCFLTKLKASLWSCRGSFFVCLRIRRFIGWVAVEVSKLTCV